MQNHYQKPCSEPIFSPNSFLFRLLTGIVDLIYPPNCAICGRVSTKEICNQCRAALIPLGPNICPKCGNPRHSNEPCPYCLAIDYKFNRAVSLFAYEEPLRDAILDFKIRNNLRKGRALASLVGDAFSDPPLLAGEFDIVIPVPLTRGSARRRGFNQSEILARAVGDATGLPVLPYAVMKKRETPSQTNFDLKGRVSNVEDSFTAPDPLLVKGKRILLVDDIITTGATVSECARALKEAGATKVVALSLARGILQD